MTPSPSVRKILIHEWVTGGGLVGAPLPASMAAEGTAMRRALARDFAAIDGGRMRVVVTLDDRVGDDPGPWIVEPIGRLGGADRLAQLARESDLTLLIAPETSGILADQTRALEAAGARLIGSSAEAVELAGDKLALAAHLSAQGIATPPSRAVQPSEGLPREAEYPAVLKPIDGAGSIDTFFLADPDKIPDDARRMGRALLQPYRPGTPMSASFLVDANGEARLLAIGAQEIVVRESRFAYCGGRIPARGPSDLGPIWAAIESVGGLRGLVGLDFVWDSRTGEIHVLEINPRPTTSVVGIVRLLTPGRLASAWLDALKYELADSFRSYGGRGSVRATETGSAGASPSLNDSTPPNQVRGSAGASPSQTDSSPYGLVRGSAGASPSQTDSSPYGLACGSAGASPSQTDSSPYGLACGSAGASPSLTNSTSSPDSRTISPPLDSMLDGLADEIRAGGAIAFDASGAILDHKGAEP